VSRAECPCVSSSARTSGVWTIGKNRPPLLQGSHATVLVQKFLDSEARLQPVTLVAELVYQLNAKQLWSHFHVDTETVEDEANNTLREERGKNGEKGGRIEGKEGEKEKASEVNDFPPVFYIYEQSCHCRFMHSLARVCFGRGHTPSVHTLHDLPGLSPPLGDTDKLAKLTTRQLSFTLKLCRLHMDTTHTITSQGHRLGTHCAGR